MEGYNTTTASGKWNAAEARMSFFSKPITNKRPTGQPVTLFMVYQMVRTNRYRLVTQQLRAITDKGANLDYVTPAGVFAYCNDQSQISSSGVLCIDLDELDERVDELSGLLMADPLFDTLLLFRSPRGNGLKWFVAIDLARCDYRTWYQAVRNYLMATYHLSDKQVDAACANPSRACYLCYDPDAYLKTELIEFF